MVATPLGKRVSRNPAFLLNHPDYLKQVLADSESTRYCEDLRCQSHRYSKLVVYRCPDAGRFKMAHAKNMAHRLGIMEGADILVNLDADNFTGPDFASYVNDKFQEQEIFLWSKMIQEGPLRTPRGISGRIAVTRTNSGPCVGSAARSMMTLRPEAMTQSREPPYA